MRFSTRGRYGLQMMMDLAEAGVSGPISVKTIAEDKGMSEHYLGQVVPDLRKAGLIKSIRGALGGYVLAKEPGEIAVGDIIRAIEGPIAPVECGREDSAKCCATTGFCEIRTVWQKVQDSVNNIVDSISLQDLIHEEGRYKSGKQPKKGVKML